MDAIRGAAQLNVLLAMTELGYRYFLGKGVRRSVSKAIDFWRQAASLGDPRGTFNLAVSLQDGIGKSRKPEDALELYEQLAEQGFCVGINMAGFCRHVGIYCIPDRLVVLRRYSEMANGFEMNRFASKMINCLRNTDHKTKLEKDAVAWI